MANLDTVRILIQDPPLYQREPVVVDGVQVTCQLKYFPVVIGTVIITDEDGTPITAFTLTDEDNGVVTFASAPTAQTLQIQYRHVFLLDAAITAMLTLDASDTDAVTCRLAAADCLDAISTSQLLILKKIEILDLKTDGPAVAKALRERAEGLRKLIFSSDYDEAAFDIIEQVNDNFAYLDLMRKDFLRDIPS